VEQILMKKISIFLVLMFVATAIAYGQLTTSSLIGTVSSPDGVLPGAAVTVRDNKTNKEVAVKTAEDGGFKVPNLEIGSYTVTVSATGFKTFSAENVLLEVGKDYTLNVQLEVGGVNETVTVTAGADIINSSDAQLNGTVSNLQIESLPLLGRNPLNFVPLQVWRSIKSVTA
jgi:hypothetical protein